MDPHSEHGDSSVVPGLASASGEGAGAQEPAEPVAAVDPPEAVPSSTWADPLQPDDDAATRSDAAAPSDPDAAEALSPAVRRLVRQYDLDITGVYGSGPAGKIRVGDIIGMLDGRTEPRARTSEGSGRAAIGADEAGARQGAPSAPHGDRVTPADAARRAADVSAAFDASPAPTTTVFECDVSRVLSHRKRERQGDVELLLASYFIAACLEALRAVPDVAAGLLDSARSQNAELAPRFGVSLTTTDGSVRRALVGAASAPLDERMRAVDAQLRTSSDDDLRSADMLIHYYAASGSLLATPTPVGAGHVGSIGIGRVRREIVVKTVDGQEAPRIAALCYLTLTFRPERI